MAKSADWEAAEPSRPIRPKPAGRRNKKFSLIHKACQSPNYFKVK